MLKRKLSDSDIPLSPLKKFKPAMMHSVSQSKLLKDRFPDIFAQIHPTKNDEKIDMAKLKYGSGRKIWWKCKEHTTCSEHVWEAAVYHRTEGQGCKFCAGKATCKCDSFGQKFPKLLKEFVAAGNDESLAYATPCGSHRPFFWRCLEHKTCDQHIWNVAVSVRTIGTGSACRYCCGQSTCKCDSFGAKFPNLLKEFIAAGNDELIAYSTACGSNQKFSWKCLEHKTCDQHIQRASVQDKTRGFRCGFCYGDFTCKCDSFGYKYPNLLEDFIRAGGQKEHAYAIACGSRKDLTWKCQKLHTWTVAVYHRSAGSECPYCSTSNFEESFHLTLVRLNIDYETQKRFQSCRDKKPLPFDVFMMSIALGETDGPQHFDAIFGKEQFEVTKQHDSIKNKFASDNNYHFIRIAWSERNHMERHGTSCCRFHHAY